MKRSVKYFEWYIGTLQNWLEGNNPFITPVFIAHAKILESCLKGRLVAKHKRADGGDGGHDHVIHVILFHVFFLNVVQCLEEPRFYYDIFEGLQVVKTASDEKMQEYNEDSICAKLYNTLCNTYEKRNSNFNFYKIYYEVSNKPNSDLLVNFTAHIKQTVKKFEENNKDGAKLEDVFGTIFASWAI